MRLDQDAKIVNFYNSCSSRERRSWGRNETESEAHTVQNEAAHRKRQTTTNGIGATVGG